MGPSLTHIPLLGVFRLCCPLVGDVLRKPPSHRRTLPAALQPFLVDPAAQVSEAGPVPQRR